jgi:hypothetical protein
VVEVSSNLWVRFWACLLSAEFYDQLAIFWFFSGGKDFAGFDDGCAVLALKEDRVAFCDEPKAFGGFAFWTCS